MAQRSRSDPLPLQSAACIKEDTVRLTLQELEPRIAFDAAFGTTLVHEMAPNDKQDTHDTSLDDKQIQSNSVDLSADNRDLLAALAKLENVQSSSRQIVFIDGGLSNIEQLLVGIDPAHDVILLDPFADGVSQMASLLDHRQDIDAIHIIGHGAAGQLYLGSTTLNSSSIIGHHADDLARIGNALSEDADILIYGCNFAQGEVGTDAVNRLADMTGADVAASYDLTGDARQGGDWDLEVEVGSIDTGLALSEASQVSYNHLLDVTTGLVGHWDFEDGSGTNASDASGNGNSGSLLNSAGWAAGRVGSSSADFSGDYDRIEIADDAALDLGSGNFTISLWYNGSNSGTDGRIAGDWNGTGGGWAIWADSSGNLRFLVADASRSVNLSHASAFDGNWHHVVVTRDGDTFRLFLDDVEVANGSNNLLGSINTTETLRIGASSAIELDFDGQIDDVRIYNRLLSSTDRTELHSMAGNSAPDITSDGSGDSASITVQENQTQVTTLVATDTDRDNLTYAITGGVDATRFTIDASTGQLSFIAAPDYENPNDAGGNNVYDVEVSALDGNGGRDIQTLAVSVTNASQAMQITASQDTYIDRDDSDDNHGASTSLEVDQGGGEVGDVRTLIGFDLSSVPSGADVESASLQISVTSVDSPYTLHIYRMTSAWDEGSGDGTVGAASWDQSRTGVNWTAGGDYDATSLASVYVDSLGVYNFDITALVQSWHNGSVDNFGLMIASPETGSSVIEITSREGGTGPSLQLQYEAIAQPPVITSNGGGGAASINVIENQTTVTTVTATDANGDTLTYSIVGGADAARFSINANTGALVFVAPPDFENPNDNDGNNVYEVTVQASDGQGGSDTQTLTITVENDTGEGAANLQTLPISQSMTQDTTHIFSTLNSNLITVSDGTAADALLQVTLSVTNGQLRLAQTTGLTFVSGVDNSAAMVIQGTESAINAALDGLQYTPGSGYVGNADISILTARAADLVGHYDFENNNADDASSDADQNGSLNDHAQVVNDPDRGRVLNLDGDRDFVTINSDFGEPGDVTLAAWVNFSSTGTKGSQIIDIDYRVMLWIDDTTNTLAGSYWNGSSYVNIEGSTNIGDNSWHHVAFVFDDSNNVAKLYLDGVEVETHTTNESIVYDNSVSSTLIGAEVDLGDTGYDFNGRIDDARIYDRALTSNEIFALAGDNVSEQGTISVNILSSNVDPIVTTTPGGSTLDEDTAFRILDASIVISDADGGDFDGGQLTFTISSNGESGDRLVLINEGTGVGQIGISGSSITYNGGSGVVTIATFSGGTDFGTPLVITFNAQADAAIVTEVARQVAMANDSDNPSATTRTISVSVTDGDGGTSALATRTMLVQPMNDTPRAVVPNSAFWVTEQVMFSLTGMGFSISDQDDNGAVVAVVLSVTEGMIGVSIGDSGVLITSGNGTEAVSFNGTINQINALFAGTTSGSVSYFNILDAPSSSVTISLTVNDAGNSGQDPGLTGDASSEQDTASQTINIIRVNDSPTGLPTITGTATEDQILAADVSAIADPDGLGTFTYQWRRNGADIAGATGASYQLVQDDVGARISVRVSYTDAAGSNEGPIYSVETGPVANVNDAPGGQPTISGTPAEGETLTAYVYDVTDDDGISYFEYQWLRDGVEISGATGATYLLQQADVGARISVHVTFTDGQGTDEGPVVSNQTAVVGNVNNDPTGLPVIVGTAVEDETLTVDTSGIADGDGLGSFGYQWFRDGVAITGATGSSYQLTQSDVGARITVQVRYTDGQGTNESLLSAQTAVVANVNDDPTGLPVIVGTATEDETLTVDTSGIADSDGLGSFGYQWFRDGVAITGSTGSSYQLTQTDVGARITVQVRYTDGQGTNESLLSAQTAVVGNVNDNPTGLPVIVGTATEDETLTVDTTAIADGDGLGSFGYQWFRDGVAITGSTGTSYQLTQTDVGARITVQVRYTDGHGTNESLLSAQTAVVGNVNDDPTGLPVIVGTAAEDETLTVDTGSIADEDGLGSFGYQWFRDGVAITRATGTSYQLTQTDVGARITVQAIYYDGHGTMETLVSAQTAVVGNVNDDPTGLPVIVGTASEDETLTLDTSGIADGDGLGSFGYQWFRDGVAITGATGTSYQLTQSDVGGQITVQAIYYDGHGTMETLVSAQTAVVANVNDDPTGLPVIVGTAVEDETLTVDTSGIADGDGLGSFGYQWFRDGVAITGATGASYQLVDDDVGALISVRVSYRDRYGYDEQIVAQVTEIVRGLPEESDDVDVDLPDDNSPDTNVIDSSADPLDIEVEEDRSSSRDRPISRVVQPSEDAEKASRDDEQTDPHATMDEGGETRERDALMDLFRSSNLRLDARLEAIRLNLDGVNPQIFFEAMSESLKDVTSSGDMFGAPQVTISMSMGTALSAGFVTWVLRGGAMLSALMSTMPAWRGFDPMIILSDDADGKKQDEEELNQAERIFERSLNQEAVSAEPTEGGK